MKISLPQLSLVVLIGTSGAGKSSFARRHFLATEVLSSDACRGWVCDDENSLEATNDAFELLHFMAAKRLERGHLTVIDATNVQPEARASLIALARRFHVLATAIVLDVPEEICQARNVARPDRQFGPHVVRNHIRQMRRSLRGLKREGFRHVHVLSPEQIESTTIERTRLWNDRREESGPFDIIGDVHGCATELEQLLGKLDYAPDENGIYRHPERQAVFVGDLVDRGPNSPRVLEIVMAMCENGAAWCVPGNHDVKFADKLRGKDVKIAHGLEKTLAQMETQSAEFAQKTQRFIDDLVSHLVFDGGNLVVAHAGLKESMQGRASGAVRSFCLYGETTGETDEWGLPVRLEWAREYRGKARVVYGHTPVAQAQWLNNTLDIDTGCVFGGNLSALRYPELEIVAVPSLETYAESARPFLVENRNAQQENDDLLDVADVSGKRILETRWLRSITVRAENATGALEVMSRFGADPRWLIHLPPTMSPCPTSKQDGWLEHPREAFWDYKQQGVARVVCEEKHMGSRAIVIVCRDETVAASRFGVEGESGIIYTRTGRRFFDDAQRENEVLNRVRNAMTADDFWSRFETDWACFDCELMPWSAKAQELLNRQYAPVGVAAIGARESVLQVLAESVSTPENAEALNQWRDEAQSRAHNACDYVQAYQRYCWPVNDVSDLRLAPFAILATENAVHHDKSHQWQMENLHRLCAHEPILHPTPYLVLDLNDENDIERGVSWWEELTSKGGEGMVIKPFDAINPVGLRTPNENDKREKSSWAQPGVKCRGREYLRIIYGPEYTQPENLERLRSRGLGAKRSLALREWSLGLEALERFVAREPLRRVHECVFGVLALESEPVDPRL